MEFKNAQFYVDKLQASDYFTFSRYGDGEWNAIKGKRGNNCDKHEYYKPMGRSLRRSMVRPIRDSKFLYGVQSQTDLTRRGDYKDLVRDNMAGVPIYDADVFHKASEAGELWPLVRQLKAMHTCIVGPEHLRRLRDGVFIYQGFIEIPERNCYLQREHIQKQILKYSQLASTKDVVYCFSASMATEVMLYELFGQLGKDNWLIDFGSVWDVYVGRKSRKYHSRISVQNIQKNLGVV